MFVPPFDSETYNEAQAAALAIVPHFTGAFSMFGSGWIIIEVLSDKKKQAKVYHRLVLCMSIYNFFNSTFYFLSTVPMPSDADHIWGARGNVQTCSLQGFFLQIGMATPLYNMYLSLYYLLLLKYDWTEGQIKRQAEPWMHAVAMTLSLGTAVACIPLKLYNPSISWCWIAPRPIHCTQSFQTEGASDCERGDNATIYMFAFFYWILWTSIALTIASLFMVYWTVLKRERSVDRYSYGTWAERRKRSIGVAHHSTFFVAVLSLAWVFDTIAVLVFVVNGREHFALNLLTVITLPLQGFFNFLIYIRPRYKKYRRENPDRRACYLIRKVMARTARFWKAYNDDDYHLGCGTDVDHHTSCGCDNGEHEGQGEGEDEDADEGEDEDEDEDEAASSFPVEKESSLSQQHVEKESPQNSG